MRKGMPAALAGLLLLALAPSAFARSAATACDAFASRACLMPFPNDMNLTVRDRKSPTGVRVHLPAKAMPANKSGKRITTGDYNRQDGFSPGQTIIVNVKGLHTQKAFNRSSWCRSGTSAGRSPSAPASSSSTPRRASGS
jgi:hypothetical protein